MPTVAPQRVSTIGRTAHMEATFIMFLVEHRLPFTLMPALVDLAKESHRDGNIVNDISLSRSATTYKLTHGLGPALKTKLIYDLKRAKFSINLDECTNNANQRVLSVLTQYYSDNEQKVVLKHYFSEELLYVHVTSVYECVVGHFDKDGIPLSNLVFSLSDNAGYMSE